MNINELLIEFDEMGFAPTTVCHDPEAYAKEWREKVRELFDRMEAENDYLLDRLEVEREKIRELQKKIRLWPR